MPSGHCCMPAILTVRVAWTPRRMQCTRCSIQSMAHCIFRTTQCIVVALCTWAHQFAWPSCLPAPACPAVIITLEVVRDSSVPTVVPLNQPGTAGTAEGEAAAADAAAADSAATAAGTGEQAEQQDGQQVQQPAAGSQAQQEEAPQEVVRSAGVVPGFALACDPGKQMKQLRLHCGSSHFLQRRSPRLANLLCTARWNTQPIITATLPLVQCAWTGVIARMCASGLRQSGCSSGRFLVMCFTPRMLPFCIRTRCW